MGQGGVASGRRVLLRCQRCLTHHRTNPEVFNFLVNDLDLLTEHHDLRPEGGDTGLKILQLSLDCYLTHGTILDSRRKGRDTGHCSSFQTT
jgi:hypothetical protein